MNAYKRNTSLSLFLALCFIGLFTTQDAQAQTIAHQAASIQVQANAFPIGTTRQAFTYGSTGNWAAFGYAVAGIGLGMAAVPALVGLMGNAAFIGRRDPSARKGKKVWGIYGIISGAILLGLGTIPLGFGGASRDGIYIGMGLGSIGIGAATLGLGIANLVQSKKPKKFIYPHMVQ